MYGTDWPYWASGVNSYLTGSRTWKIVTAGCPTLTEEQKQWILAENAERFLRFELPVAETTGETSSRAALRKRAEDLHRENIVILDHDHNPISRDVPLMLAGGVTAKVYQLGVDVEIDAITWPR